MLSVIQAKVLNEIKKYKEENDISPTVRELAQLTGLKSTSTIHGHLSRLERKGYIKRNPASPRSIAILDGRNPKDNTAINLTMNSAMEPASRPGILVKQEDLKKIKSMLESLEHRIEKYLAGVNLE